MSFNVNPGTPSALGSLRLTPSNSPFSKPLSARSPIKTSRPQSDFAGLSLRQVIGTTTCSVNGLDCLPSAKAFAFTAGGAAVIATVEGEGKDCQFSQRFYRARPTAAPLNAPASAYGTPTPANTSLDNRRTHLSLRDGTSGLSPFGSPAGDWGDSPSNKTWSARERIKAATCVSFSPDGKFLAVGETGYKPRVLIFSTSPDIPSDAPVTSISEHGFGVQCVAFSPDSRYLASLGSLNDGFLYIWNVNPRTGAASLHSTNKCTANINQLIWLGSNLITVGTRHVKLWRLDDQTAQSSPIKSKPSDSLGLTPSHRTLPGRNCLLGPMLDATFTDVIGVSPTKALVCSEKGDICLLDDGEGSQKLTKISSVPFGLGAMTLDSNSRIHFAGTDGSFATMALNELMETKSSAPVSPVKLSPTLPSETRPDRVVAITSMNDYIVTVDSKHTISLLGIDPTDEKPLTQNVLRQVPGHGTAVLGVSTLEFPNVFDASFLTFSSGGRVLFWDQQGVCKGDRQIQLEQPGYNDDDINELKVIKAFSGAGYLVSGDKYGVLRITNSDTMEDDFCFKAHSAEITSIAISDGPQRLIASSGRDRMVQIFENKDDTWDLIQTLDEHVGAVNGLLFYPDGTKLLSSSSDRTIVVRDLATLEEDGVRSTAFVIIRTITLKATPVSMTLDMEQNETLLVSTMDRHIHKFDFSTGKSISSFKSAESDQGDPVVMSTLVHVMSSRGSPLIAGVSSTDKSIRLYEENGSLLCKDWGHTEGVSDITLVSSGSNGEEPPRRCLVTVAVDGTIFLWDMDPPKTTSLQQGDQSLSSKALDLSGMNPPKDLVLNRPPLRRVFSHSELARFQRSSAATSPILGSDENADTRSNTPVQAGISTPRSPKLRKKASGFKLAQTPKLDPSPSLSSIPRGINSTFQTPPNAGDFTREGNGGRKSYSYRNRSPSPPSPRTQGSKSRRASVDARGRTKAVITSQTAGNGNSAQELTTSTETLCRQLRNYRKKLAQAPTDTVNGGGIALEAARELERELAATARALGERALRAKRAAAEAQKAAEAAARASTFTAHAGNSINEELLVGLLDRYSERLVEMMEKKVLERQGAPLHRKESVVSVKEETEAEAEAEAEVGATGLGIEVEGSGTRPSSRKVSAGSLAER